VFACLPGVAGGAPKFYEDDMISFVFLLMFTHASLLLAVANAMQFFFLKHPSGIHSDSAPLPLDLPQATLSQNLVSASGAVVHHMQAHADLSE
jgi:hypothetical protein